MLRIGTIPLFLASLLLPSRVGGQGPSPYESQEMGFVQRLGETLPLDLEFRDDRGRHVRLQNYFSDRPVILVLAYNRCPGLCNVVLAGLVKGLRDIPSIPGRDFEVVVVSIDHREGPALARPRKEAVLTEYGREGTAEGWHFLTGKPAAIRALADAVGFQFFWDQDRDLFRHSSGIMILTPQGKLARYLFGFNYQPAHLRLGLLESSEGKVGSPVDQALLFTCMGYDPDSGSYLFSPMKLMRLSALATVLCLGFYLWRNWRKKGAAAAPLPVPPLQEGA